MVTVLLITVSIIALTYIPAPPRYQWWKKWKEINRG